MTREHMKPKIDKWNSKRIFSKRGFKCAYCGEKRKGVYRWVDGGRSCGRCNRNDPPTEVKEVYSIDCPLCKGKGKLTNDQRTHKALCGG